MTFFPVSLGSFVHAHILFCGPGSVVGIATSYGLDGPEIESRWGARFSATVQTGPGGHPAFCTMGTGSFPGVKNGRGVTLTPHPFPVPWSWKSKAIALLPLWAVRPVQSLTVCTRVALCLLQYLILKYATETGIVKSVKQLAKRWKVWGLKPSGSKRFTLD
jgi:hypothetical protein